MLPLQEISDRIEIQDLFARYSFAIDERDWDALDSMFTPDARIDYTEAGGAKGSLAEMKAWLPTAMELGHKGVRVNSVHPGGVDTIMSNHDNSSRDKLNTAYANVPLQRIGGPEEVAAASLFLASDDASYIHGTEIVVDGGMTTGVYYAGFPGSPGFS